MLIHLIIFNTYSIWPWIEVEQTSKNRNSNIPNFRGLNFEHIQTSHLNPKPTSQTSLNTELFANFINNSSKILKTEPWTCPNIWFWPKTELQTSRISPKTKHFANIKQFVPPLALTLPLPVLWARKSAPPNGVLWIRKKKIYNTDSTSIVDFAPMCSIKGGVLRNSLNWSAIWRTSKWCIMKSTGCRV